MLRKRHDRLPAGPPHRVAVVTHGSGPRAARRAQVPSSRRSRGGFDDWRIAEHRGSRPAVTGLCPPGLEAARSLHPRFGLVQDVWSVNTCPPDGTPAAVACTAGPGLTLAVAEGRDHRSAGNSGIVKDLQYGHGRLRTPPMVWPRYPG